MCSSGCAAASGVPKFRPYEGLFASNIFWPRGVKGGTSLPYPRSPQSRHVPPPPYPPGLPFRVQKPARSCLSYGLPAFFGSAAEMPRCPPPPCPSNAADRSSPTHTPTLTTTTAGIHVAFMAAPSLRPARRLEALRLVRRLRHP